MSAIALSPIDLAAAAALLVINGLISIAFRLGIERTLALATIRMVAQLGVIGFVLRFVLADERLHWTLLWALVMIVAAGFEIASRQSHRIAGAGGWLLGSATLLVVGSVATFYAVGLAIGPTPWWSPRYLLPIFGMVLGNMLTGISLALDTLADGMRRDRPAVEARLALGATGFEAAATVLQRALRTAMMPLLNAMAATGLVTLPGMMTGQIVAGADPVEAAKYQLLVMFLITGATGLGVLIAAIGGVRLMTDDRHRLRLDRIIPRR